MSPPLSEKLRPQNINDIYGQDHLVGANGFLTKLMETKKPLSILLYGPPGSGKTTIARLYGQSFDLPLLSFSATSNNISDIKKSIAEAKNYPLLNKQILLFVDEIHRFNKAQQDIFLPLLEEGTIILIGATTENPSFNINSALLSRLRTFTLKPLSIDDLEKILVRFEKEIKNLDFNDQAKKYLLELAQGDARHLINLLENLECLNSSSITLEDLQKILQKKLANYDTHGDQHHSLISALHKSVRSSDPDAALYWLSRMLEGGEDLLYISRRVIRMATEDIGVCDPQALSIAIQAYQTYELLGSPEGELALAQAVVYLALSPKSNSVYVAFQKAQEIAQKTTHLPPPPHAINAPTKLMQEMGLGKDYIYDHDTPAGCSGQNYFPQELERITFYEPQERGFEREMKKRLEYFSNIRKKH
jgi:putative ATPase